MASLATKGYDPAAAVIEATDAALALTAIDTTNLRNVFVAPSNGKVMVRLQSVVHGATTFPQLLFGVLDGATVRGRVSPGGNNTASLATTMIPLEANFIVEGLTAGNTYTWDAAYGVEFPVASTGLKYGGPNNTTANDAFGAFNFEIWETDNLLDAVLYDPATAVTKATTALLAMTAFDTTNLRIAFTAPASGKILYRIVCCHHGGTVFPALHLGVLSGATVVDRVVPRADRTGTGLATTHVVYEGTGVIGGLTPGTVYTYDAAYGIETISGGGGIKYGGPNNATQDDAFGAIQFEIWEA